MRNIFVLILAVLAVALVWTTLNPSKAHAADVQWDGPSLVYQNNTYTGPASDEIVKSLGLPEKTTVYIYVEPSTSSSRKAHIIYFAPGVDPGNSTQTNYRTYSLESGKYTNPSTPTAITLAEASPEPTSSCDVEDGLGWIICPVTNTLAGWMDGIFNILVGFLEVRPIDPNQKTALYNAWSNMRTIANIAFVIAFLIIIYSQISNFGISNYSIKKLLPRIIVAAVLVNLSYIICSLAIDISNILGYNIQSIFIGLRNMIVGEGGGNSWEIVSWSSVSSFVLSGGALAVGGGAAAITTVAAYGVAGALALLLPSLVVLLLAVLVALLVMAGRQALITILTIVAPLAFVAYLLPNTEKWFEKWRGTFLTMLILFPAFSVIFGGSQLAGTIIIQNANSINLIILGMIVQVAPLFITPFLIKFSGSLLGRIAGIVNNPNRGIIDRTRNFTKDRTESAKAKRLATPAPTGMGGLMQRVGQRMDSSKRRREGYRSAYSSMADANWTNSDDFRAIDALSRQAADTKALGEATAGTAYNQARLNNPNLRDLDIKVRQAKLNLSNSELEAEIENWDKNRSAPVQEARYRQQTLKNAQSAIQAAYDSEYEIMKSAEYQKTAEYASLSRNMRSMVDNNRTSAEQLAIHGMRRHAAQNILKGDIARSLESSADLRDLAGAQIIDKQGALKALAMAQSEIIKAKSEAIAAVKDSSPIAPGDISGMVKKVREGIAENDTITIRAYIDMLSNSANPGYEAMRDIINEIEVISPHDTIMEIKDHINSSASINASAEDIGTWSRDVTGSRKLKEITLDKNTWAGLSPEAFAGMKKSSQHAALDSGGISKEIARQVLNGPAAQKLKSDVLEKVEKLAS